MEAKSKICPVCSKEFQGTKEHPSSTIVFCPNCGWMRVFMPEVIPDVLQKQEEERLRIAKEAYAKLQKHSADSNQITNLKRESDELRSTLDVVNNMLLTKEKEVHELEVSLSKVQEKLEQQKNMPMSTYNTLLGIVCVKNRISENKCFIPIYSGVNTYGSSPDSEGHHQIKLRCRGIQILPKHFEVQILNKRIVLRDLSGGTLVYNGMHIPSDGIYAESSAIILLGNDIEISVSQI